MAPARAVENLSRYVQQMCGCGSHGGRVHVVPNPERCIVSDVPAWTDEMTLCVKTRFPNASVSVHQTHQSLSGFNVIIALQPAAYAYAWHMASFAGILAFVCYVWYVAYTRLFFAAL